MHDNKYRNASRAYARDLEPCIVCGKAITTGLAHPLWLHTAYGSDAISPAEAATIDPAADSGAFPIGADCLRKHPELKPYLIARAPTRP